MLPGLSQKRRCCVPENKLPSGELVTIDNVDMLCLGCTLPDCDEESRECLIRIAKRNDPKLRNQINYRNWLAENYERKVAQQREYDKANRERNLERFHAYDKRRRREREARKRQERLAARKQAA
jgi:hypothetical protein